jgi:hypothetical protein
MPNVESNDQPQTYMQAYCPLHSPPLSLTISRTQPEKYPRGFLALPGEIRNQIYDHLFRGTTFNVTAISSQRSPSRTTPSANNLSLLRTCRQIHAETRHFPYSLSTFSISCIDDLDLLLDTFTKPQREAITSLQIVPGILPGTWYWGVWLGDYISIRCPRWWDPEQVKMPELPGLKRVHIQVAFDKAGRLRRRWSFYRQCEEESRFFGPFSRMMYALEDVEMVFRRLNPGVEDVTCEEVEIRGLQASG